MDEHILIALIAALINLILAVLVPCVLNKSNSSMLDNAKALFNQQKHMLVSSSVLVAVVVYLSLKAAPVVKSELSETLLNLAQLGRR
jgi:hypothetical protein